MQWGLTVIPEWNIDAFTNLTLNFPNIETGLNVNGTLYVDSLIITGQGADIDVNQGGHFLVKPSSSGFSVPASNGMVVRSLASLTLLTGPDTTHAQINVYGGLNLDSGSTITLQDTTRIIARDNGVVNVYEAPTIGNCAEIGAVGGHVNNFTSAILDKSCSCYASKSGGTITFSAGKEITLSNGAFVMASSGGMLRMENGSKIVVESGSTIRFDTGGGVYVPSGAVVEVEVKTGGEFLVESQMILDGNGTLKLTGAGDFTIEGSLQVKNGATLEILPGVDFTMGTDAYVSAQGKLNVNGTSANPVTFDWPSQYSALSKIYLSGSGANGSSIQHAVITDAKYGIYASGVNSLSLDDVHIYSTKSGSYGVYGYNLSNTEMNNLDISGVKSRGIYLRGGSSNLTNSVLGAPATYGVYLYNASFNTGDVLETGSNEILGGTYGVWAQNSWAGLGEWSTDFGGDNRITGQTSKAVYARSGSDIVAQLNWWGSYPPPSSKFYKDATSTIDYSNALTSPPSGGAKTNPVAKGGFEPASLSGSGTDLPETGEMTTGRLVKWLLDKRDNEGRWASRGAAQGLLMSGIARMDRSVQTIVTSLMLGDALAEGDGDLAIRTGETYLNRGYLLDWERAMIAEVLFDAYLQDGQDMQKAAEMAAVVRANGDPEDADRLESLLVGLGIDITDVNKVASAKRAKDTQTGPAVAAYPNPFNPATTLQIEMETAGPVSVTIYDSLGRLITTPFDGYREAGMLTVSFDASALPSGTYLYRVRTETGVTTGNVLLVK